MKNLHKSSADLLEDQDLPTRVTVGEVIGVPVALFLIIALTIVTLVITHPF